MKYAVYIALTLQLCVPALAQSSPEKATPNPNPTANTKRQILGYLERVRFGEQGAQMIAKLDTGADTSSVEASHVELYLKPDKTQWVKFSLNDEKGKAFEFDERVVRVTKIKTKMGGALSRPVVKLPVCIGGYTVFAEVNLADRTGFNYKALIGRELLSGRILVDSETRLTSVKVCPAVLRP